MRQRRRRRRRRRRRERSLQQKLLHGRPGLLLYPKRLQHLPKSQKSQMSQNRLSPESVVPRIRVLSPRILESGEVAPTCYWLARVGRDIKAQFKMLLLLARVARDWKAPCHAPNKC